MKSQRMRYAGLAGTLLAAVLFAAVLPSADAGAALVDGERSLANPAGALTYAPTDDAFVWQQAPRQNMGDRPKLKLGPKFGKRVAGPLSSYLRFDLSDLDAPVTSATLRLRAVTGGANGGTVFPTTHDWSEDTVTFESRPARSGPAIGTFGAAVNRDWVSMDVASAVDPLTGLLSVEVAGPVEDLVKYWAKEGRFAPELIVVSGDVPPPTPTPTPTATPTPAPTPTATATPTPTPPPGGDTTPPVLTITDPTDGSTIDLTSGKAALASGTASDAGSGVVSVTLSIDGSTPYAADLAGESWTANLAVPDELDHELTVRAVDGAGNEAEVTVGFRAEQPAPDEVLVADDVMAIDGAAAAAIETFDEATGEIVFAGPDAPELEVGMVLVGDISEAAPGGFLRRVTTVESAAGTVTVTTAPATLLDVFLQVPGLGDPEPAALARAGAPVDLDAACIDLDVFDRPIAFTATVGPVNESVSADVRLTSRFCLDIGPFFAEGEPAVRYFELTGRANAELTHEFAIRATAEQTAGPFEIAACDRLPSAAVKVPVPPLFIIVTLDPVCTWELRARADGEVSFSTTWTTSAAFGARYTPESGVEAINERTVAGGETSIDVGFGFEVAGRANFGIDAFLFGILGPRLTVGPELRVRREVSVVGGDDCTTVDWRLFGRASLESDPPITWVELPTVSVQENLGPFELFELCSGENPLELTIGVGATEADASCEEPGRVDLASSEELFVRHCIEAPPAPVRPTLALTSITSSTFGQLLDATIVAPGDSIEICCTRVRPELLVGLEGGTITETLTVVNQPVDGGAETVATATSEFVIAAAPDVEIVAVPLRSGARCPDDYGSAVTDLIVESDTPTTVVYCAKNTGGTDVRITDAVSSETGTVVGLAIPLPAGEERSRTATLAPSTGPKVVFDRFNITYEVDNVTGDFDLAATATVATRSGLTGPYSHEYLGRSDNDDPIRDDDVSPDFGTGGSWFADGSFGNDFLPVPVDEVANDELHGGPGVDLLNGGGGDDLLFGEDDKDIVIGGDGNDDIDGGLGEDVLSAGEGTDIVIGGPDSDVIGGGGDNDLLLGGAGDDFLAAHTAFSISPEFVDIWSDPDGEFVGDEWFFVFEFSPDGWPLVTTFDNIFRSTFGDVGQDALFGNEGRDNLEGGDDADRLDGGPGSDTVFGGDGDDAVDGGPDADLVDGGAGSDVVRGGLGNDQLQGRAGDDTMTGGAGDDYLLGIEDNDVLWGGDGIDELQGNSGDDVLHGGDGDDELFGWGRPENDSLPDGNDRLFGGPGQDFAAGHEGNDVLVGGAGDDQLAGGEGDDELSGGLGLDLLFGLADNDELWGGPEADQIQGNGGNDRLFGGAGDDFLLGYGDPASDPTPDGFDIIFGGAGADVLAGGDGADELSGGDGIDQLFGQADPDEMWGNDGDDVMQGGGASDVMHGGVGDDVLSGYGNPANDPTPDGPDFLFGDAGDDGLLGEFGDDELEGGTGNDFMDGGADNDTYIVSIGDGADTVRDALGANRIRFGEGIEADSVATDLATLPDGRVVVIISYGPGDSILIFAAEFTNFVAYDFADGSSVDPRGFALVRSALSVAAVPQAIEAPSVVMGVMADAAEVPVRVPRLISLVID